VPKPTLVFRPATPADAPFAAKVTESVEPYRPMALEDLREKWINTAKGSEVRRFIVEEDGGDTGWISMGGEWIAKPGSPPPVSFDPAHPYVPSKWINRCATST